jgi:hypothetical protein
MSAGVIDFSGWNNMPWWNRKGYRTREEAWANANLSGMCIQSAAALEWQQTETKRINEENKS